MLEATLRAIGQVRDRAFRSVLVASILWTLLAFVLLVGAALGLIATFLGAALAGVLGTVLAAVAATWAIWLLFVPIAAGIATFYTDRIAASVEARWYPALPQVTPARLASQIWDGITVFLRLAAAQLLVFIVLRTGLGLLLPGVAAALWLGLAGWAYARGVFVTLAMRRLPRSQALAAWRRRRLPATLIGVLVSLVTFIPVLNLVAPILGIAALVHVLQNSPKISIDNASWRDSTLPRVLPRSPD